MFGNYEILERINTGGMAETIKARATTQPGRPIVALKRVLPHLADDPRYTTMFRDEARLLARLEHDNVVRALDMGDADGVPYIALEFVHGQDARMLLHHARRDAKPIPVAIVCHVIAQAAAGLHHAHELADDEGKPLGLVHRDVSLQNILVDYNGEVKVIDFGIAMAADNVDRTETGIVKGKFGYMAPEQVTDGELDRRGDVFSLGICLWELLTGERLFPGKASKETIRRVREADAQPPSTKRVELPPELDQLVMKALAREPAARFQTAEEMRRALLAFMAGAGHECGAQDLARYMREVFEAELRKQPSPDVLVSEVARRHDEATGLEAFGELDPVSTVSTLSSTQVLDGIDAHEAPLPPERPRGSQPAVPPMRPRRDSIVRAVQSRWTDGAPQSPPQIIESPVPAPPPRMLPPPPAVPRMRRATPTPLMVPLPGTLHERANRLPRWAPAVVVTLLGALTLWFVLRGRPGMVELYTSPPDVNVTIDDEPAPAGRSPFMLRDIKSGTRHKVVVSRTGHEPWSATFTVRAGETLRLPPVTLRPTQVGHGGE